MQGLLRFVSTLAVGFILAAMVAIGAPQALPFAGHASVDYGSLGLGLVIGVAVSSIAGIGWSEVPRRIVAWLVGQRATFGLMAWALVFGAVLMLY